MSFGGKNFEAKKKKEKTNFFLLLCLQVNMQLWCTEVSWYGE